MSVLGRFSAPLTNPPITAASRAPPDLAGSCSQVREYTNRGRRSLERIELVLIIAIVVALNRDRLVEVAMLAMVAVVFHNALGLVAGYWIARLLSMDEKICRTLSIEVGMQNSGLAVALALKYFSAPSALPGALFSIWHNLSGSVLAARWSRRASRKLPAPRGAETR